MAKDKLTEYDATAANNTVVGDVNLAENSALPSDMNNAVRELMSHQKEAFGSGTPLYVDQTNNRVGIGTVAPDSDLKIKSTGAATLRLDGGAVAASVGPLIVGEHNDTDAFYIGTNSVVLGESSNQDVVIYGADSSSGNIRFYAGASTETARIRDGGGITFNGDTAAANALDDYEEGSWTPSVGGTATYSTRMGRYQKVGNIVHAQFEITINSIGTGNAVVLSGWPYASANLGTVQTGVCSYYANSATNITWLALYIENNASTSQFVASDGTASAGVLNGPSIFGNSTVVFGAISYFMA